MTDVTIFHNPRCSKSRQTLALLEEKQCDITIVEYLKNPPNGETLAQILSLLQITPRQLMRTKEAEYSELNLASPQLTTAELISAMVTHPKLIERPIVLANNQAAIGRPPEQVLAIL